MARCRSRTLILATSVVAVRQWRQELLRRTSLKDHEVGEYSGQQKSPRAVTIATYQVLTRGARRGGSTVDAQSHLALLAREDCVFRLIPDTHSGGKRTPVPAEAGHRFRLKADRS